MRTTGTRRWTAPAGVLVCALVATTGAAAATGARAVDSPAAVRHAPAPKLTTLHFRGLRNVRYCEIFLINKTSSGVSVRVSNTTGVDPCGNKEWKALNAKTVAKNRGVDAVFKNGQRWWVLDQIVVRGVRPRIQSFGRVQARDWGGFTSAGARPPAYGQQTINRDTQWWYRAGRIVYVLIAPDGKSFVMQAYSRIVDKNLKLSDLMSLGSRPPAAEGVGVPDQHPGLEPVAPHRRRQGDHHPGPAPEHLHAPDQRARHAHPRPVGAARSGADRGRTALIIDQATPHARIS